MTTFVLDPTTDLVATVPRTSRQFQRRQYRDKQFLGGEQAWQKRLDESTTVYVGNLSCYTNEYQLYELFSRCGSIKKIIMGLNNKTKTPCGFCFVEYDERFSALKCVKYLNRTFLEGREIKIDMDAGFQEGRQFGRGTAGGQISDERKRNSGGHRGGANQGSGNLLTRSITVVACLTMISILLIFQQPQEVSAGDTHINFRQHTPLSSLLGGGYGPLVYAHHNNRYEGRGSRYININKIREAQITKQRKQFEKDLALFLVNLMKSAKPTLMKAFIQATLADKQLKETAIGLFFGSSGEESESDDTDKEKDEEKEKDSSDKEKDKDSTSKKKKGHQDDKTDKD